MGSWGGGGGEGWGDALGGDLCSSPHCRGSPPSREPCRGRMGLTWGLQTPRGGTLRGLGACSPPHLLTLGKVCGGLIAAEWGGGVMGLGSEHPWPCLGTRAPPVRSPGMSVLLKKQSQKFCKAKTGVRCWGPAEGGCRMRPSAGTGQGEGSVGARVGGWGGQWPDSAHAGPRATLRGGAALLIFNCWCPAVVVAGGGGGRWWALVVVGSG